MGVAAAKNWQTDVAGFAFRGISERPTRRECNAVFVTLSIYILIALFAAPYGSTPIAEIPALSPFLGAVILITDLSTGFLLFVIFYEARHVSLMFLGCAYLYAASMVMLYLISFPGMLRQDAIVAGTSQSSAWCMASFYIGYGLLSLIAVAVACFEACIVDNRGKAGWIAVIGLIIMLVLISGIYFVLLNFADLLPPVLKFNGSTHAETSFTNTLVIVRSASVGIMLLTLGLGVFLAGPRSRVFLWLCASTAALLSVNILTLTSGGRDTLGWSLGRMSWMLSSSVLFLFFMTQFVSQLRFLARLKTILETEVQKRTIDLTQALRQRDLLLREVYHRVRNNMQVIDSMLFLERRKVSAPATLEFIDILRQRIFALGLVHQQLMASEDMEHFGVAPFIHALVENLGVSQAAKARGIRLETSIDEIAVNLDFAIPLGLLITELVINSFRHVDAVTISVGFRRSSQHLVNLTVQDHENPEAIGVKPVSNVMPDGEGSKIIDSLIRQLDGQLEVTRAQGLLMSISMPAPNEGALG